MKYLGTPNWLEFFWICLHEEMMKLDNMNKSYTSRPSLKKATLCYFGFKYCQSCHCEDGIKWAKISDCWDLDRCFISLCHIFVFRGYQSSRWNILSISLLLNQKQWGVAFSSQVWNNFEFLAFKSELEFSYVYIYFEDVED